VGTSKKRLAHFSLFKKTGLRKTILTGYDRATKGVFEVIGERKRRKKTTKLRQVS